jgi:hypothetical protein
MTRKPERDLSVQPSRSRYGAWVGLKEAKEFIEEVQRRAGMS